jgi:hypothetical protein
MQHGQGNLMKKLQKNLPNFKEARYEIVKFFGGFWLIFSFFSFFEIALFS